jgi:hypothetical protein
MCRSIKTLRRADDPATEEEIRAAALQFVRKVSGYRAPAARNADAFDAAVDEITAASQRLLDGLVPVSGRSRQAEMEPHHHGDGVVHSHAAG